jgi:hypothetical protein
MTPDHRRGGLVAGSFDAKDVEDGLDHRTGDATRVCG